jgi:hypothetical protein
MILLADFFDFKTIRYPLQYITVINTVLQQIIKENAGEACLL